MKISSPFLQNVIKKNFDGKSLEIAGFAGLVTKSNFKTILPNEISNILNDKLFNSLFNQIFCTKSHEYKNNISNNISDIKDTEIGDYGVLFPFAGCCDENGKEIKLESIKGIDPQLKDKLINKIKNNSPKLKLIKKILSITSFETLCELIASLNVSYAAESPFSNLNNKTLNGLKKQLIEAIIDVDDKHFSRLVNAQLNNSGKLEKFDYFFDVEGENECYQFMVTQINKEDLITKKLTPKFNHNE